MGKDLKNNQALKDISLFLKKDREEYAYEIGKEKKAEIRQIFLDFIGGLCTSSGCAGCGNCRSGGVACAGCSLSKGRAGESGDSGYRH